MRLANNSLAAVKTMDPSPLKALLLIMYRTLLTCGTSFGQPKKRVDSKIPSIRSRHDDVSVEQVEVSPEENGAETRFRIMMRTWSL